MSLLRVLRFLPPIKLVTLQTLEYAYLDDDISMTNTFVHGKSKVSNGIILSGFLPEFH
jgi:hypothetical protein